MMKLYNPIGSLLALTALSCVSKTCFINHFNICLTFVRSTLCSVSKVLCTTSCASFCTIQCHKIRCCHSVDILDIIPFCILDSLHFSLTGFKCWIQYCECHFFRGNPSQGNSCFGVIAASIISNRYFFNVLTPLNWVSESSHYVPHEFSKLSPLLCICSSCFLPDMYFYNHHIHVLCSDYCLCYSSFHFIVSLVSNNIL